MCTKCTFVRNLSISYVITQFSAISSRNNFESTDKKSKWWAGPDLNRRPSARQAPGTSTEELLTKFREFLKVDLRRSDKTAYEHTYYIKRFLNELPKPVASATVEDVREYLKNLKISSAQYKNILMALKVFFRDFLKMPEARALWCTYFRMSVDSLLCYCMLCIVEAIREVVKRRFVYLNGSLVLIFKETF